MATQLELMAKNEPTTPDQYVFKLSNAALGDLILAYGPDGWDPDEFVMERNMSLFGIFYKGSTNVLNFDKDGRDYLQACYESEGINTIVTFEVTENVNNGTTRQRYIGKFDYSTYKISELGVEMQVVGGAFSDFIIGRSNVTVNLLGEKAIDGTVLAPIALKEITVPALVITQISQWERNGAAEWIEVTHTLPIALTVAEFEESFTPAEEPNELFFVDASQEYLAATLQLKVDAEADTIFAVPQHWIFELNRIVDGLITEVIWSRDETFVNDPINHYKTWIYFNETISFDIAQGDSFSLTVRKNEPYAVIRYNNGISANLSVIVENVPQRTVKGLMYHEAMERLIMHYTGLTGRFRSTLFGRVEIGYPADGYLGLMTSGKYIRGLKTVNDTLPTSLNDSIQSLSAVYCAGMGVEQIAGLDTLVIEDMAHFFQSTIIIDLSNRIDESTIGKSVYADIIFNEVKVGYNGFDYQRIGGIYEYNTANSYSAPINAVSKSLSLISSFRADMNGYFGLVKEPIVNKDVAGESDMFIFDLIRTGMDLVTYKARLWDGFIKLPVMGHTNDLLNLLLTPARNIRRWGSYIRGFANKYLSMDLIWQRSDKSTELSTVLYGGEEIKEKADINLGDFANPRWCAEIYEIECPGDTADIEIIKANPYGLFKLSETKYGWMLRTAVNNSTKKLTLKILKANMDFIFPSDNLSPVKFGRLYNHFAYDSPLNIAAAGWRVTLKQDFDDIAAYYQDTYIDFDWQITGGHLKDTAVGMWSTQSAGADNLSELSVRGGGYRDGFGAFQNFGIIAMIWVSATNDVYHIHDTDDKLGFTPNSFARNGCSVYLVNGVTTLVHGETSTYTGNDGFVYPTICIGTKEYVAAPLKETKFRDGSDIPVITSNEQWAALLTAACCSMNNNDQNI